MGQGMSTALEQAASTLADTLDCTTSSGILIRFRIDPAPQEKPMCDRSALKLYLDHARLKLLRGFGEPLLSSLSRGLVRWNHYEFTHKYW